jgi:hypothetical protein
VFAKPTCFLLATQLGGTNPQQLAPSYCVVAVHDEITSRQNQPTAQFDIQV